MSEIEWSPWIEHDGGEQPVSDSIRCQIKMRSGIGDMDDEVCADEFFWEDGGQQYAITHYRIPMEDYRRIYGEPDIEPDMPPAGVAQFPCGYLPLVTDEPDTGPQYDPNDVAFSVHSEEPITDHDTVKPATSDGSTASYYELPEGATQLQDLISYRNMNAQDGEMFRALYRKGLASHSDQLRDAKKVLFYAQAEVDRLGKYGVE